MKYKLTNIYIERIVIDSDEFPYSSEQEYVCLAKDDVLIIEFNHNLLWIFTLDNKIIEYSLEILRIKKPPFFHLNRKSNNNIINNHFLNNDVIDIKYLVLNEENNEVVIHEDNNILFNLIGVKITLSNKSELYLYSSEPEIVDNKVIIYRPNSIICLILNINGNKINFLNNTEFPNQFLS